MTRGGQTSENDFVLILVAQRQHVDGNLVGCGDSSGFLQVAGSFIALADEQYSDRSIRRGDGHSHLDTSGQVSLLTGESRISSADSALA